MLAHDRRANALARLQHGAFSTAQLDSVPGWVLRHRTECERWELLRPGVYAIAGTPDTWERRLWVALLAAGDGAVVGRRSAARLHRLPAFGGDHLDVVQPEASVPRSKPTTSRRTSRLPDAHVSTAMGFPVTSIARTIFDIAGLSSRGRARRGWVYVPAARVERMLDDALVGKRTTIADLTTVFVELAGRGRPGTRLMRELLAERSTDFVPTESELEALFVRTLDAFGVAQPRRQVVIGDGDGPIGRVDFLYAHEHLVVELDGQRFHGQRQVQHADRKRDLRMAASGWRIVRLDWTQLVEEPAAVAGHLLKLLDAPPG